MFRRRSHRGLTVDMYVVHILHRLKLMSGIVVVAVEKRILLQSVSVGLWQRVGSIHHGRWRGIFRLWRVFSSAGDADHAKDKASCDTRRQASQSCKQARGQLEEFSCCAALGRRFVKAWRTVWIAWKWRRRLKKPQGFFRALITYHRTINYSLCMHPAPGICVHNRRLWDTGRTPATFRWPWSSFAGRFAAPARPSCAESPSRKRKRFPALAESAR